MSYKSTHTGAQIDAGVSAALNPDATPTPSSTNLVTSGGVAAKLSEKQDTLVFDNAPASGSNNPVKSGGIYTALADKASNADLALKAPLDSPTFTGTPTAPTPTAGDNSTKIPTTAFVRGEIAAESAALEQQILAAFPTEMITNAAVASFTDGADGIPVKRMTVKITPVQAAGTPSPENPLPISGWTGANIKNASALTPVTMEQGGVDGNGQPVESTTRIRMTRRIPVKPSTSYTIAFRGEPDQLKISVSYFPTETGNRTGYSGWLAGNSFTTSADTNFILAIIGYLNDSDISPDAVSNVVVYETSSAALYPVSWQTEAGTVYGGTLKWLGNNQWKVTVLFRGVTLTGDDVDSTDVSGSDYYARFTLAVSGIAGNTDTLCNMYVPVASASNGGIRMNTATQIRVYDNTHCVDTTTAKAFFNSNNLQVVYKLATPVEYTFTASDSEIRTLLGSNNIFADCGDVAELTYRADVGLYIDKKLAAVLPADPTTDGAYVLTDTVADGTATKSWESNA